MADAHDRSRGGGYGQKILVGVVLVGVSFVALWLGSPLRTGGEPNVALVMIFNLLFALGFILGSMGLMGAEQDYPALVSGLVLYFIVGALVAAFLYVTRSGVGAPTLSDVDSVTFWAYWIKVAAMWPYELILRSGVLGFSPLDRL